MNAARMQGRQELGWVQHPRHDRYFGSVLLGLQPSSVWSSG